MKHRVVLLLLLAVAMAVGACSKDPPLVGPKTDTEPEEVTATVVAALPDATFLGSLQGGGDTELDGHVCLVFGALRLFTDGFALFVEGTVTIKESVQDYTTFGCNVYAKVFEAPPGWRIVRIVSATTARVPTGYSTPTQSHTIVTVPMDGFASGVVTQLDQAGRDLGYAGVIGVNMDPVTIIMARIAD